MRNKIMHKGKIYVEFILCDGLVIAQNRSNFSHAQISSFRVFFVFVWIRAKHEGSVSFATSKEVTVIYKTCYHYYYDDDDVLNHSSLVCKISCKHWKQTLPQRSLDHHGCPGRRHDFFTQNPTGSKKHCFLLALQIVMTWNNVQPPCNTCVQCSQHHWNNQCPTLPHTAYLHSQVTVLRQLLSLFPGDVVISRTADINKKTSVCFLRSVCRLISEADVKKIGTDLLRSTDGCIPHHSDVVRLHKPIRMMPVPSALHWNPKTTDKWRPPDCVDQCHSSMSRHYSLPHHDCYIANYTISNQSILHHNPRF